jgi:lipopolysaccharide transport system ATP-binding protein
MGAVQGLCTSGILLKNGTMYFIGTMYETINHYIKTKQINDIIYRDIDNTVRIQGLSLYVYFLSVRFLKNQNWFATNESITFIFEIKANRDIENFRLNTTVFTLEDIPIGSVSGMNFFSIKRGETKTIRFSLVNHQLALGEYYVSFSLGTGNFTSVQTDFDIISQVLSFKIEQFEKDKNLLFSQWSPSWGNIIFQAESSIIE